MTFISIILVIILVLPLTQCKEFIFITSEFINCKVNQCDGSILHPYDSFFYAVNNHQFQDNQIYSFVFEPTNNGHYLMLNETFVNNNGSDAIYYDYKTSPIIPNNSYFNNYTNLSIEIIGLLCENTEFINSLNANELCSNNTDLESMIQLYVKDDDFDIMISGNLTIDNIVLNGFDVFYQFSANENEQNCYTNRAICCDLESCTDPFSIEDYEIPSPTRGPLFVYNKNIQRQLTNATWTISNSKIYRFGLLKHACFFEHHSIRLEYGQPNFRLILSNTIFDGYLSQGLIINEKLADNTPSLLLTSPINDYSLELHDVEITLESIFDQSWVGLVHAMGKVYPIDVINGAVLIENANFVYTNEVITAKSSYVNITNLSYTATDQYIEKNILDFNQSTIFITDSELYYVSLFSEITGNLTSEGLDTETLFTLPPWQKTLNVSGISSVNNVRCEINGLTIAESFVIFGKYIQIHQGLINLTNIIFENNQMLDSSNIAIFGINQNLTIDSCMFNDTSIDAQGIDSKYIWIEGVTGIVTLTNLYLYGNGWIKVDQTESLIIDQLIYEGNSNRKAPPVFALKIIETALNLTNSRFSNLISSNGLLYIEVSNTKSLTIQNTSFINNTGLNAGALQIRLYPAFDRDIVVNINDCIFENNSAVYDTDSSIARAINSGYGGAINLYSSDLIYSNVTISNSNFTNNRAKNGGGAIYWSTSPPKIFNNTFKNNTATYGNNVASKPIGLIPGQLLNNLMNYDMIAKQTQNGYQYNLNEIFDLDHFKIKSYLSNSSRILNEEAAETVTPTNILLANRTIKFNELISGSPINKSLLFYLIDIYNQVVQTENELAVYLNFENFSRDEEIQPKDSNVVISPRALTTFEMITNGVADFSNITLSYWPNSQLKIIFNVSLEEFLPQTFGITYPDSVRLDVKFRNCYYGELLNENTGECFNCSNNTYTLRYGPNIIDYCQACPPNVICFGGNRIAPIAGYWRYDATSSAILQCPNRYSCIGVDNEKDYVPTGRCMDGYAGNMCAACDQEDHAFINNECVSCTSNPWYYIRYILVILIQLLIIVYGIRYNMRYSQQPVESINEDGNLTMQQIETILSDQLKLLITYFQLFSIIASFRFGWPELLVNLYSVNKYVGGTSEQYFNLDCFLVFEASRYGDEKTYLKYLIILIIPYIFMILAFLFWVAYFKIKKRAIWKNPDFTNIFITTLVIAAFNFQPYVIKYAFMLFQCENLYMDTSPLYYWAANYQVKCFTSKYLVWALGLGLPTLIIWIILLPSIVFIVLYRNRGQLGEYNIRSKYSFLYRGYTRDKFYWEFLIMFRKIGLLVTLVFLIYVSKSFQAIFATTVLTLALCIQIRARPHIYPSLNKLEEKSLISLLAMTFSGWYFYTSGFHDFGQDWFLIVMIFVANIYFLISWIFAYIRMQYKKNNKFLTRTVIFFKRIFTRLKISSKQIKSLGNEMKIDQLTPSKSSDNSNPPPPPSFAPQAPFAPRINSTEKIILESKNSESPPELKFYQDEMNDMNINHEDFDQNHSHHHNHDQIPEQDHDHDHDLDPDHKLLEPMQQDNSRY